MVSAYSPAQLTKYLKYLALPAAYEPWIQSPASYPKTEEALTTLFRGQITRFPYDNLDVHYAATSDVNIDPQAIYSKLMGVGESEPSGRGGYCLECSIFFSHVLRGLGFDVYSTGVRNRPRENGVPAGEFFGWTHIVNIVRLPSGVEYHVDAAFGGDGPTRPLPLISGQTSKNLGPQEVRLVYGNMAKQTRPEQKVWMYQYRNGVDREWNTFYSFAELEFFQEDFEVINRFTSWDALTKRNRWVVKFIRAGETGQFPLLEGEVKDVDDGVQVVGKVMFVNDVVKLNMGGKTRVIDTIETDRARVAALKKWFSLDIVI
ncbi:hypothetical protein N7495_009968 [Penicillium taxi]|uniref:uncharacterized protein n=1 Tax=Penicillium taxi TaxID=168475 RepID=UPI002545264B|nr:uncharacterized protein N7495_009968 [Penicillium taxi]KAJ5885458.1 hypothetical protein N7495_009968 [Penicillium taxi]